jgi:hypothetical protein
MEGMLSVLEHILELVDEAGSSKDYERPLECMSTVRKAALEEDEATEYNG